MNPDVALYWVQQALQTSVYVTAPLLGAALVIGLAVSLFQTITSIQEMTLTAIPKMAAVGLLILLLGPWMLQMLTDFTVQVIQFIPNVSH